MYKISISILCIFLIICIPITMAQDSFKTEEVEEAQVKGFVEEDFLEGGETSLIINVDRYEPTVVVSSLLEEQNVPVYAFLSALPTESLTLPRIQSVSVSVIGGDKKNLVGGVSYHKPIIYSWDDLGHLSFKLKKVAKEKDVPDTIDVELKAKIRYEAEVTSHLMGGKETKELFENPKLDLDEILVDSKYSFFGGRGVINAERISKNSAAFALYNSEGALISKFSVSKDKESSSYNLIKGSTLPEDFVRVRVDEIVDKTKEGEKPFAEFNLGEFNVGDKIGECTLTDIRPDRVYLQKAGKTYILRLRTEEEIESYDRYVPTGQIGDTLTSDVCGTESMLRLENIDTKKSVKISLLSGKKRAYTETTFWLHLPVDKRAIKLSPKAIDNQINKTRKQINALTKNIDKLEKIVEGWRKVCLATVGAMLVINFFTGTFVKVPGALAEASREQAAKKAADTTFKQFLDQKTDEGKCKPPFKRLSGYKTISGDHDVYIYENDMRLFWIYNKNSKKCEQIAASLIRDPSGNTVIWSSTGSKFVPYSGLDSKEMERVYKTKIDDKNAFIIPLTKPESLRYVRQQYTEWKVTQGEASKGMYAVVYEDRSVEIWQGRGKKIDVGDKGIDEETDDKLAAYSAGDKLGKTIYDDLERNYLRPLIRAQAKGDKTITLDGVKYNIDTKREFYSTSLKCEDVMDKWQCVLIYNACDPVICPNSRCNLGGEYRVKNVIQSGFLGSLILCIKNFPETLVPFCLSGFLASMKNIRSFLQGYEKCLIDAKVNGKSTGICDKVRSIFICEIIWKEFINLVNLKGGIISIFSKSSGGGKEYVDKGIGKGIESARDTVTFFANDYATNMFIAYKGRSTKEIGTEICKRAVAGTLPNFGDFIEEIAEPEDPVQFTAYFEEHPYSPTRGESRYQVYYHIYAGKPRVRERVSYKIYLKSKGKPYYKVDEGSLASEDYVDKSKDFTALSGYQEICVSIDGAETCGFGKTVSTSYMTEQLSSWYTRNLGGLSKDIKSKEECVPEDVGYIPKAAIRRTCSVSNPHLGLGVEMEKRWQRVGRCGVEGGKDLGFCWEYVDLTRYPELEQDFKEDVCANEGGIWCRGENKNMKCGEGYGLLFKYDVGNYSECCLAAKDATKEEVCVSFEKEEVKKEEVEEEVKQEGVISPIINEIKQAKNCEKAEEKFDGYEFKDLSEEAEAKYWVGFKCYTEKKYNKAKSYLQLIEGDYLDDAYYFLAKTYDEWADSEVDIDIKKVYYKKALDYSNKLLDKISNFYSEQYADKATELKNDVEKKLNELEE